jgi:hypothetical protein
VIINSIRSLSSRNKNCRKVLIHGFFLKPKVNDKIIEEVSNRRAAYLREGLYINSLKNQNPHKRTAIAEEGYLPVLIGYPINKIKNKAREKIYEL